MDESESQRTVTVVHTLNRRSQSVAADQVDMFLRKHPLFRVEIESPVKPKKKARRPVPKPSKVKVEEKTKVPSSRRRGVDESSETRSSVGPGEDSKRRRVMQGLNAEASKPNLPVRPPSLITLSLKEAGDIVRLFMSSPAGCVDWAMIASTVTGGRLTALEVEFIANEFIPSIHYRPSLGMVVMERQAKLASEYQKHRTTMKRLKQGLELFVGKLKSDIFTSDPPAPSSSGPAPLEPMLITLIGSPENEEDEKLKLEDTPAETTEVVVNGPPAAGGNTSRKNNPAITIDTYLSALPEAVVGDLHRRAQLAIARFQKGDIPHLALKAGNAAETAEETFGAKPKRRYETKAMRLAKQASASTQMSSATVGIVGGLAEVKVEKCPSPLAPEEPKVVAYEPPPFFAAAVRKFTRSE